MFTADQKLSILMQTAHVIQEAENLDQILPALSETAKKVIDADRCSIFLYDENWRFFWQEYQE